jgi:hypothetical protein
MQTLLLHNPLVQFYLLFIGALSVALICDYLRHPLATRDGFRTPRNDTIRGGPPLLTSAGNKKPPRPGSSPGRWPD